MVNRNLIRGLDVGDDELDREIERGDGRCRQRLDLAVANVDLNENAIVEGRIIRVDDEFVLVDVGYKSEGIFRATNGKKAKSRRKSASMLKVLIEEVEESTDLGSARHDCALASARPRRSKTGTR